MNAPRACYTGALRLATPLALLHLARRTRRQTGARDDWRARLGRGEPDSRHPLWLHAASAGEMQSLAPLADALAPDHPLRLSAFTATGRATARRFMPGTPCDLAPLDLPGAWRRYLDRVAPRAAVLVETELWPNLMAAAAARRLPVVLASARLGPGTARRLARFPGAVGEMLGSLTRVLAQTEADLERFVALGLPPGRGRVTGSLKDALAVPHDVIEGGRALRAGPLAGRRAWVAGSLREGEEAPVAEAVAAVREAVPDAVAVVVPRHPETSAAFRAALAARGVPVVAAADLLDTTAPVARGSAVVVDRVGVLFRLYAAADAAFVGGSLAPVGGHNVLEPALLGLPVVVGPNLDNIGESAGRLRAAGGLSVVSGGGALGAAITAFLGDEAARAKAGDAARRAASNPRVLEATLTGVREALASAP